MMTTGYNLQNIRTLLIEGFSEEELRHLCYDTPSFRPVYDQLAEETAKGEIVDLLLEHAERRLELETLLALTKERNPARYIRHQPYLTADPSRAPSPLDKTYDAEKISRPFDTLLHLIQTPQVRAAVVAFQTDFQATGEQITILNDYKRLHDLFQDLENCYNLIDRNLQRLPGDETAWDSVLLDEPELQSAIHNIQDAVREASFDTEAASWLQQLNNAQAELHLAVESFDLAQLQTACRRLQRILAREPSRNNTRLVAAASALRLDALIRAMFTIRDGLARPGFDVVALQQFEEGLVALTSLSDRLTVLVHEHTCWQEIDDELRRIEANLVQDMMELKLAWPDLKTMSQSLYGTVEADWAISLIQVGAQLESALATAEPPVKLKRYFRSYRSQTSRRFRQVDDDLLALCQDLQKIGEPLNLLLRIVQ